MVVLCGETGSTMSCSEKTQDTEFLCVHLYIFKINIQKVDLSSSVCVSPRVVCVELRLGELPTLASGAVSGGNWDEHRECSHCSPHL